MCIDLKLRTDLLAAAARLELQFLKNDRDFPHHNALEDAIACDILLSALSARGVTTIKELAALVGMRLGTLYTGGYNPCSIAKRTSKKA